MSKSRHECVECDAVFTISHQLDETYYEVTNCPFCGAEIEHDDLDDDDEELS